MKLGSSEDLEGYLRDEGYISGNQLDTNLLLKSQNKYFWDIFSWHVVDILRCGNFDTEPDKFWGKAYWYGMLCIQLGEYFKANDLLIRSSQDVLHMSWSVNTDEINRIRCQKQWKVIDTLSIVQPSENMEAGNEDIILLPDISLKK